MELEIVEILDKYPRMKKRDFLACCERIARFKWPATKSNRPLTEYQLFVQEAMKTLKDADDPMTSKERMKFIAQLWKEKGY